MVIHGGIDGYSRLIVYLECSSNNKATTVARLFLKATEEFCWPSRVRTDKGGENVEVARLMLEKRGEGRGSIIQGSSVHNQRIERLWRDTRRMVVEYFRRLFYFLEEHNVLDVESENDLYSLQYVFIPRINKNLIHFRNRWNNHKLSTEHQKTPNQLYILGMMQLYGSNYTAVKEFFESNDVDQDTYGVSEDLYATESSGSDEVVVPEIRPGLSPACVADIRNRVDPLEQDDNHGISLYLRTKEIIAHHQSQLNPP